MILQPPRDLLRYKSKEYPVPVELLEPFFAKYPARRPAGNGRGYWAQYAFKDDQLIVQDLLVTDARNLRTGMRSIINEVLQEEEDRNPVGFSGLIVLHPAYKGDRPAAPNGKGVYIVLEIKRGRLRAERSYEAAAFDKFREDQFTYFQMTDEYEVLKAGAKLEFEKSEQEARRKDPARGYKPFDDKAFDTRIAAEILLHCEEIFAD